MVLMQTNLFSSRVGGDQGEEIPLSNGGLFYCRHWLSPNLADTYFTQLHRLTDWEQSFIQIAGRRQKIPRLNAWYGDSGADYRYSGTQFRPRSWTRPLMALRSRLQNEQIIKDYVIADKPWNSALLNLYRNGNDSVAWHADDEPELGLAPCIASISLGATRRFLIKRRDGSQRRSIELIHGSLLLMLPPTQAHWLHCLPKTTTCLTERINVTFRCVELKKNKGANGT
jgi:alkylated DNA repair dioxygenase AlkB